MLAYLLIPVGVAVTTIILLTLTDIRKALYTQNAYKARELEVLIQILRAIKQHQNTKNTK